MTRTLTSAVESCRLADQMETLAREALTKMRAAEDADDEPRMRYYDEVCDGYTQLMCRLDNFERELRDAWIAEQAESMEG